MDLKRGNGEKVNCEEKMSEKTECKILRACRRDVEKNIRKETDQ